MAFTLRLGSDDIIERPQLMPPPSDAHKYARGHAVLVSGPKLRTGAIRLSARASLAVGAGVVTIVGEADALAEHAAHLTAIMLRERDPNWSVIDERVSAIAIGPAAGVGSGTERAVLELLGRSIPIVLDADAMTSFSNTKAALFGALHGHAIMTPHGGEFGRLFPDIDLSDRKDAALTAAQQSGAILLLKGAETIIASPDGRLAVNHHSSSWLATAGSGDVLTGIICGLLAQGAGAFEAAAMGAWLHGDIGLRYGPGLTADAMPDQIPLVLRDCLAKS